MTIDHRLKISTKMRPAILVLFDPIVAGETVADDDLRLVGPAGALPKNTQQPDAAIALLRFLSSPEAADVITKAGLKPLTR